MVGLRELHLRAKLSSFESAHVLQFTIRLQSTCPIELLQADAASNELECWGSANKRWPAGAANDPPSGVQLTTGEIVSSPQLAKNLQVNMATAELESVAEFKRRASALGVTDAHLKALLSAGFDTFGKFAFSVPYVPGAADEKPLVDLLRKTFAAERRDAELACLRRLF